MGWRSEEAGFIRERGKVRKDEKRGVGETVYREVSLVYILHSKNEIQQPNNYTKVFV